MKGAATNFTNHTNDSWLLLFVFPKRTMHSAALTTMHSPLDYLNKRDTIGAFVSTQNGVRSLPWRRTKQTNVVCE